MKNPSWSWLCICIYTFQAQSLMFSVHLIKFIDTVWWSEAGSSPIQVCCVHLRFDSASELMQVKDWTCTRVSMSLVLQFGVYFSLLVTVQYYFTLSSYILPSPWVNWWVLIWILVLQYWLKCQWFNLGIDRCMSLLPFLCYQ